MFKLWNQLFHHQSAACSQASRQKFRRLAFESMEERRLLAAAQLTIGLDGAYNTAVQQAESGTVYTLSATAQLKNYQAAGTFYMTLFFSSDGLDRVTKEKLTADNTQSGSYFSVSDTTSTLFPYFKITPKLTASLITVVLNRDTANADGDEATDWYLNLTWNESQKYIWQSYGTKAFGLFDFVLPISEQALPYSGSIRLNFAGYDNTGNWNIQLKSTQKTVTISDTVTGSRPHYEIELPGILTLDTPVISTLSAIDYQSVSVSWDTVADADAYNVQWRTGSGSWLSKTVSTANCTIDALSGGTVYQIQVQATANNGSVKSGWSSTRSIETAKDAPDSISPTSVSVDAGAAISYTQATFTATDPNPAHKKFTFNFADTGTTTSGYFRLFNTGTYAYLKLAKTLTVLPEQHQTIYITASDEAGFTSKSFAVEVTFYKSPKAAVNQNSVTVSDGAIFYLSAKDSTGYYGETIASYAWDWNNDGKVDSTQPEVYIPTAELGNPNTDGTYTVSLTVTDSAGHYSTKKVTVTVEPAPACLLFSTQSFYDGQILKINLALGGTGTDAQSWEICWDMPDQAAEAEWITYNQAANTLQTAHYYQIQGTKQTYSLSVRVHTAKSKPLEFSLTSYTVPGSTLTNSSGHSDSGAILFTAADLPETEIAVPSQTAVPALSVSDAASAALLPFSFAAVSPQPDRLSANRIDETVSSEKVSDQTIRPILLDSDEAEWLLDRSAIALDSSAKRVNDPVFDEYADSEINTETEETLDIWEYPL